MPDFMTDLPNAAGVILDCARETGAGIVSLLGRDDAGVPCFVVVGAVGEQAQDLAAALQAVETEDPAERRALWLALAEKCEAPND